MLIFYKRGCLFCTLAYIRESGRPYERRRLFGGHQVKLIRQVCRKASDAFFLYIAYMQ